MRKRKENMCNSIIYCMAEVFFPASSASRLLSTYSRKVEEENEKHTHTPTHSLIFIDQIIFLCKILLHFVYYTDLMRVCAFFSPFICISVGIEKSVKSNKMCFRLENFSAHHLHVLTHYYVCFSCSIIKFIGVSYAIHLFLYVLLLLLLCCICVRCRCVFAMKKNEHRN